MVEKEVHFYLLECYVVLMDISLKECLYLYDVDGVQMSYIALL
jgi:hypothetical protein